MQRHGGNLSAGHWMKKPTEKATLRLQLSDIQEKTVVTVNRTVVARGWRGAWGGMSRCSKEAFRGSKTSSNGTTH